jgi:TyrR family helix-turn-helix protein
MSETEIIDLPDLPKDVARHKQELAVITDGWSKKMTLNQILQDVERKVLLETLKKYETQCEAAAALGVSQPTIARRLKKYDIK